MLAIQYLSNTLEEPLGDKSVYCFTKLKILVVCKMILIFGRCKIEIKFI